jgi:hypothetical protein
MKRFGLILLLALTSCSRSRDSVSAVKPSVQAPVVASASVDKALVSTEDTVTFSVVIDRDQTVQVPIPDIGSLIKGFRITDFGTEEKSEDQRKITRKWFSLRADVAGSYILPEIDVSYSLAGQENTAKTAEIFVEVQAPGAPSSGAQPGAQEDIRDIKPLEKTPTHFLAWLLGAAAVGLLAALGLYFYRRRKPKEETIARLPAHEEALQRLEALAIPHGSDALALKRYYFSLSEILRSYAENRYGFRATDMTSEEIIQNLRRGSLLPEDKKPTFIEFLKETDIVKFTDFSPPEEAIASAKERVKTFVRQTSPFTETTESVV